MLYNHYQVLNFIYVLSYEIAKHIYLKWQSEWQYTNTGSPWFNDHFSMTVQIYNSAESEVVMTGPQSSSYHSLIWWRFGCLATGFHLYGCSEFVPIAFHGSPLETFPKVNGETIAKKVANHLDTSPLHCSSHLQPLASCLVGPLHFHIFCSSHKSCHAYIMPCLYHASILHSAASNPVSTHMWHAGLSCTLQQPQVSLCLHCATWPLSHPPAASSSYLLDHQPACPSLLLVSRLGVLISYQLCLLKASKKLPGDTH